MKPRINLAKLQAELQACESDSWLVRLGSPSMLEDPGLLARATLGAAHRIAIQPERLDTHADRETVEAALVGTRLAAFMHWLCYPQLLHGKFRVRWHKFGEPKGSLDLTHLATAAAQFLISPEGQAPVERKVVGDGLFGGEAASTTAAEVLIAAADWAQLEHRREVANAEGCCPLDPYAIDFAL